MACAPVLRACASFLDIHTQIKEDDDSQEREKRMLITISKMCKELRDHRASHEHKFQRSCIADSTNLCDYGAFENCLMKATETLVIILVLENDFISHACAKTLLSLSAYLRELGSNWKFFLQFTWNCLKHICLHLDTHIFCCEASHLELDKFRLLFLTICTTDTNFVCYVKSKVTRSNCSESPDIVSCFARSCKSASHLFQLLRKILKPCKSNMDAHMDIYFQFVETCIADITLIVLEKSPVFDNSFIKCSSKPLVLGVEYLFGSLLQFFCSLVHQLYSMPFEMPERQQREKSPIIEKIIDLVPKLSANCLALHNHEDNDCISHYLRHKCLMLMMRLADCCDEKCSTFILLLNLLWKHCEDLLLFCLTRKRITECEHLVESPFSTSLELWESNSLHHINLQIYVIYLFLRCSFSVIKVYSMENIGASGCQMRMDIDIVPCSSKTREHNRMVVEKLIQWSRYQVSCSQEIICSLGQMGEGFTSSFIQLFMNEDNIMFKMLLELLEIPKIMTYLKCVSSRGFQKAGSLDACLGVLEALMPNAIFFEFLAKIQYDHSIIMEYLISKDTGFLCLQYLMRCLRALCNSWPDCLMTGKNTNLISHFSHSRKCHILGDKLEVSTTITAMDTPNSRLTERENDAEPSFIDDNVYELHIDDVKSCLVALHDAIKSLQSKNLFPYNPLPLLKRLKCFLQLLKERPICWKNPNR